MTPSRAPQELPPPEEVRSAVERLLRSPQFAASPRAARFLRFIVETTLEGRQDSLKEYVLGVEVFDRSVAFDPATDTIVRVEAVKLRKRLQAYYSGSGQNDPVIIEVPKGAYVPQFQRGATERPARDPEPIPVAVLPFASLSQTEAEEQWCDGLTDEILSLLSRVPRLRVVSRTSAFAFKGQAKDVREIGRDLCASWIVEGSVRTHDTRVRVSARLTDTATGFYLWSSTTEHVLTDSWAVQQEIARTIMAAVHAESAQTQKRGPNRRHSEDPEAFELYLRGRQLLDRFELSSQQGALEVFKTASTADDQYPLPLLGIARCSLNLAVLGVVRPKVIVPTVKATLRHAISLDPDLAEAYSLLGTLIARHEWKWAEAEEYHRIALRLNPHGAEVHDEYATSFLAPLGRMDEALGENRAARQLDPFSPQLSRNYIMILMLARRLPDASRECRRWLEQQPDDGYVRLLLAVALHGQGRLEEALSHYERVYRDDPSLQHEAYTANVRALLGDRAPAQQMIARLGERSRQEWVPAMVLVWLHLHVGQVQEAMEALEQACANQEYELQLVNTGYGFDPLRNHPRFRAILEKTGFR
ncbi:MAG TPA: tetratricopeptide repeat protein [Bryobacteraceae bacterium]|nr:tetratricopeptide repeat protein [Bryobacteraceae bacterium]